MAKFMFVYRNNVQAETTEMSPEEMQQAMAKWGEWYAKLGTIVVDGGDGLIPNGKRVHSDGTVTDGPFIEAKEMVGGFTIVEADDVDAACEHAKGCPILEHGGNVEVRQLAGYSVQV